MSLSLPGCRTDEKLPPPTVTTEVAEGALWAVRSDGVRQRLTTEGEQGYQANVSSDSNWIIVDAAPLSTLQVTRVFRRTDDGSFAAWSGEPLATRAWTLVEESAGVAMDELIRPRTRFVRWQADQKQFILECSWSAPDGEVSQTQLLVDLVEETVSRTE